MTARPMRMLLALVIVSIGGGGALADDPENQGRVKVQLAPAATSSAVDELQGVVVLCARDKNACERPLFAKPMNTRAEASVLLMQMRVASSELQTLIRQNARISQRLRHKDRANHRESLATLRSVRDAVDAEIKKWEEKLSTVGDDGQLANIDLQNMLQKQQQTLQTMSNVSKMLHDTAMAIIRKIG